MANVYDHRQVARYMDPLVRCTFATNFFMDVLIVHVENGEAFPVTIILPEGGARVNVALRLQRVAHAQVLAHRATSVNNWGVHVLFRRPWQGDQVIVAHDRGGARSLHYNVQVRRFLCFLLVRGLPIVHRVTQRRCPTCVSTDCVVGDDWGYVVVFVRRTNKLRLYLREARPFNVTIRVLGVCV